MDTKDSTWLRATVGRVEDGCAEIPDDSVDLAVFSPPYFERDGYSEDLMLDTGKLLGRVLKEGARAYMVFGQILEQLDRPLIAQRLVLTAGGSRGLAAAQTIIWVKSIAIDNVQSGHYQPINSPHLMNYCFEYVFGFVRGKPTHRLARTKIGVPYADKTNLNRGTRGKNGDCHCPGDAWFVPYSTVQLSSEKDHRHGFPLELARRLIAVSGIPEGSTVLDPFLGGGTTAIAARLSGMNSYGNDRDDQAVKRAVASWKAREGDRWSQGSAS